MSTPPPHAGPCTCAGCHKPAMKEHCAWIPTRYTDTFYHRACFDKDCDRRAANGSYRRSQRRNR